MSFEDLNWHGKRGAILARDKYVCQECGRPATEVDHCWPKSLGGQTTQENLRAICKPCNLTADTAWDTYLHHSREAEIHLREATSWWNINELLGMGLAQPEDFNKRGKPTGNDVLLRGAEVLRMAAMWDVSERPTEHDPDVLDRPSWIPA
jgi:hypothetical protein